MKALFNRSLAIALGVSLVLGVAYAQETIDRNFAGAAGVSSTVPVTVQGDILFASAANTLSKLAKNTNATRYLANTGTNNNPAWAQVSLANGVTGDLTGTTRSGSNYTLTGAWTWNTSSSPITINTTGPRVQLIENDAGTDLTAWDWIVQAGLLSFRTRTDADGVGKTWLSITRGTTTAISAIAVGNATDSPAITLNGPVTVGGTVQSTFGSTTATQPLRVQGDGSIGQVIVRGAAAGASNVAYVAFHDSGATNGARIGYIGDDSGSNSNLTWACDVSPCNLSVSPTGTGSVVLGSSSSSGMTINNATAATANIGAAGAPPAQVVGYITATINGTVRKIPYYAN